MTFFLFLQVLMATGRGNSKSKTSPVLTTSCLWGKGTLKSNTISRDNLFGKGNWGLVQGRGGGTGRKATSWVGGIITPWATQQMGRKDFGDQAQRRGHRHGTFDVTIFWQTLLPITQLSWLACRSEWPALPLSPTCPPLPSSTLSSHLSLLRGQAVTQLSL